MLCVKCGKEYEGDQCPRCEGPVVLVNNSDYIARRKAYEEKQKAINEALKKKDEKNINIEDVLSKLADRTAFVKDKSRQDKKNTFTKCRFKRVMVYAVIAVMLVLSGIGIYKLATKKHYALYMSYNGKIYDVTKVESNYVCELSDAIFAADDNTFYTAKLPEEIDKSKVISSISSDNGKKYATVTYNENTGDYAIFLWDDKKCVEASRDRLYKEIMYISNDGQLIYSEMMIINDEGKISNTAIKLVEFSKNDVVISTIEGDVIDSYVYSWKNSVIYLNGSGELAIYDYSKKSRKIVELDVTGICAMCENEAGVFSYRADQPDAEADAFMYVLNGSRYYYSLSDNKSFKVCGNFSGNYDYIYDTKNGIFYEVSLDTIKYAKVADGIVGEFEKFDSIGGERNYIFIKNSSEFIYVNKDNSLIKTSGKQKKVVEDKVTDGSLTKVFNKSRAITYVVDGDQYYRENADKAAVGIYFHGKLTNTDGTCYYRKRIYFYDKDNILYSCTVKGTDLNNIGKVDRMWLGTELK